MTDDFENGAAVETPELELPSGELALDEKVVTPEPAVLDERVFTPSTGIPNAEGYNRQQIAEETGMALGNGGVDGRTVTEVGRQVKANAEEEKKSQFFEAQQQAEAMRKEWMEKDHDFGGMKMSGHDLAKMLDFISNPQMQDKLRDRLGKSGVPKEKIDKGMKELNEYIDLKKKEQEGKLTPQELARLKEINESKEFKVVAQEVARQAKENGLISKKENDQDLIAAKTSLEFQNRRYYTSQLDAKDTNSAQQVLENRAGVTSLDGMETARQIFANAPHAKDDFTTSASLVKPLSIANDATNHQIEQTIVAQATNTPQVKARVLDVSFG